MISELEQNSSFIFCWMLVKCNVRARYSEKVLLLEICVVCECIRTLVYKMQVRLRESLWSITNVDTFFCSFYIKECDVNKWAISFVSARPTQCVLVFYGHWVAWVLRRWKHTVEISSQPSAPVHWALYWTTASGSLASVRWVPSASLSQLESGVPTI